MVAAMRRSLMFVSRRAFIDLASENMLYGVQSDKPNRCPSQVRVEGSAVSHRYRRALSVSQAGPNHGGAYAVDSRWGCTGMKSLSYTGCHTARWMDSGLRWISNAVSSSHASAGATNTSPSASQIASFGRPISRLM